MNPGFAGDSVFFRSGSVISRYAHTSLHVNLLVALNQESREACQQELAENGLVMIDTEEKDSGNLVGVPLEKLAVSAGGKISANTVAAGACLGLLGAPIDLLEEILKERFAGKSADILEMNLTAARLGFDHVKDVRFSGKV